jgi:hypothetical protein
VTVGGELRIQTTVRMPGDLFLEVTQHARRESESISDAICHLIEWGLERGARRPAHVHR